nr:hypothetical protein [Tanacetum cinerariifolium]
MLVPQGEGSRTPTESHHTPTSEASQSSQHELPSPLLPPVTTATVPPVILSLPLPTVIPTDTTPLRHYTKRARIGQSSALPPVADESASPLRDGSQGEACPTDSGLATDQDMANIAKTSTLTSDSTPRVNFLTADEGIMQQKLDELTALCTSLRLDEGEEATERVSDDTEEMATELTSMDAASILTSGGIARDAEVARIHAEEELQMMINRLDRSNETLAKYLQEYEQILKDLSIGERIEVISDLVKYQKNYAQVLKYQTLQRKPRSKRQKKDYYMAVIKGHAGWKTKDFKEMSFEQIEAKFNTIWKQIEDFIPMGSKEETERLKRKGLRLEQESAKKLNTSEEVPEENLMHAPVEWKLYDTCGVHHVTSKDKEIFMLVEKDCPLRKGLAIVMISYKLQVKNYSQMASDLILKIHKIANRRIVGNKMHKAFPMPVMEFPLSEEVSTASEESSHCQKKRDAPAEKIALLLKSSSICQSKSYDSYAKLVIEFGDSYETPKDNTATGSASDGTSKKKGRTVTLIADDMQKRKNDVKERTTLLLALPDEHQLRFSKHKTAQELWAAILKTFGGNEATIKAKKNLLKQQYGNFKAEGSETLEQIFNRLQVIASHLEFMDIKIEHDDLNQKFLTSLPPEWLMHITVWRNMSDLDTMSLDELYNHLKVYESEVQKKSESNSQNMAFISSAKHNSGNEEVNTASVSTASTNVSTASANIGDINHIDEDDMEEMDIKWNMALLSMGADRFWKKIGKKISIQGTHVARFEKSKVECFNCHKMGHFARECRAPKSQDKGR